MTNTNDKEGAEMFANVFTCRLLSEVNYATMNYTFGKVYLVRSCLQVFTVSTT